MEILYTFLILASISLVLGIILSIASILFYVKLDSRVEEITKLLPGYNCGACGCPGCVGFAQSIVSGKEKNLSKCKPGKKIHFLPILELLKDDKDLEIKI